MCGYLWRGIIANIVMFGPVEIKGYVLIYFVTLIYLISILQSIKHHETSWNHKNNIKQHLREEQKKNFEEKKKANILQREIQKIQQAANQSYQNDILAAQTYYNAPKNGAPVQNIIEQPLKQEKESQSYDPHKIYRPTYDEQANKLEQFYKSKGIISTNNIPPPNAPPPMPTSLSSIPLPPPPPLPSSSSVENKDKEQPENMFAGFKEYYKKFYEEFKKNKTSGETEGENTSNVEQEEEIPLQPYGEWEDVDTKEEAIINSKPVLVEDSFTKQDQYFARRKPVRSNFEDSDDEDSQLASLESKDCSENPLFSDDEDNNNVKVVFKKRKRKATSSTQMRKRRAISLDD